MWKPGPLPPDTWNWGGVVPVGDQYTQGFYFADFCGDHVKLTVVDEYVARELKPEEVAFYNNCLELPPGVKSRV